MGQKTVRSVAAGLCGVVGVSLILMGGLAGTGRRAIFDSEFFADRIAHSLTNPDVADYAAALVADAVIERNPDLLLVRPLLVAASRTVVSSAPFRNVVRTAVRESHHLMATASGHEVLLSIADFGILLRSALATRPDLAEMIPDDAEAVVVAIEGERLIDISAAAINAGQRVVIDPRIVIVCGMLLLGISVLVATNHETALLRAGIALVAVAGASMVILELGSVILLRAVDDPFLGRALAGVWGSFVAGFWPRALILAGFGLLLAAAATAYLEYVQLDTMKGRLREFFSDATARTSLRLIRALILVAIGGLAMSAPQSFMRLFTALAGGIVVFVGIRELCRLAVPPQLIHQKRALEAAEPGGGGHTVRLRVGLIGMALTTLLIFVVMLLVSFPDLEPVTRATDTCNGSAALCARPLNEVVFAATHNAMGAADVDGWLFPNQQRGIRTQLEDGIRAFMIDVTAGTPVGGAVKTELEEGQIVREKFEPALGVEGVEAAMRIRDRLIDGDPDDRELFLCHGLCELGADALIPVLRQIYEFLVLNPREVIIIIIEDAVSPKEIEAAFIESRLVELVYRGSVTPPWPTLGEMVQSDQRVLVLAENDSSGVPWYHPAFAVLQETPYHFSDPSEFSNEPNRGGQEGSLLLMNHWIASAPSSRPSDAARVNTYEFLLARARTCQRERGMLPNIIAVDFYRTGDLFRVVEMLNRRPRTP